MSYHSILTNQILLFNNLVKFHGMSTILIHSQAAIGDSINTEMKKTKDGNLPCTITRYGFSSAFISINLK